MSADSKHSAPRAQTLTGDIAGDELAAEARAFAAQLRARAREASGVNQGSRRKLPSGTRPGAPLTSPSAGRSFAPPPPAPPPPPPPPRPTFGLNRVADELELELHAGDEPFAPAPAPARPRPRPPARAGQKVASQNRPRTERPKGTRSQREYVARRRYLDERARKRLAGRLDELREHAKKNGGHGVDLVGIPDDVWLTGWACVADCSGKTLVAAIRLANNTAAKHALLSAALNFTVDGFARYRLKGNSAQALRARRIATTGVLQLMLKQRSKQLGPWGGGVVRGITQNAFCAMLRDVNEPRPELRDPHPNTVFGKYHRKGATAESGQVGYYQALVEAGFGYREQPKPTDAGVHPCETAFGPYCTSRYRICHSAVERSPDRFRHVMCCRLGLLDALFKGERALERELVSYERPRPPPD